MRTHFYYGAIRKTLMQFANIFSDVQIAKYDTEGHIIKYIKVPVKFAPKDSSYQNIFDSKRAKAMPMIAIQFYSLNHDPLRIGGKAQRIPLTKDTTTGLYTEYLHPVPYNFDFQVDLMSNHMVEMDQMLEQVLTFFNPFTFIRLRFDELQDHPFDLKVMFTSANPNTELEQVETTYRITLWTLYFTIYGYLFTPVIVNTATGAEALIKDIITKYYTSETNWAYRAMETMYTSGGSGSFESESVFLRAIGYDTTGEIEAEQRIFSVEDYGDRTSTPPVAPPVPPGVLPAAPTDLGPDWIYGVTKPDHLWTLYKGNWRDSGYGTGPWTYLEGKYYDVGNLGNLELNDIGTGTICTSAGIILNGGSYAQAEVVEDTINDLGGTFTLFADFTCTNATSGQYIMALGGSYNMYTMESSAGGTIGVHIGNTAISKTDAGIGNNNHYQVVYVQNATAATLYVNGVVVATGTVPAPVASSSMFTVGADSDGTHRFAGTLNRLAVGKDIALTQAEVTALYQGLS